MEQQAAAVDPTHLSCGVDIVDLAFMERAVTLGGERFLARVYTAYERRECRRRIPDLATRFAAKEAIAKALGTGIRGIDWREIEVFTSAAGQPSVRLYDRAAVRAAECGLVEWSLSLSHSRQVAIATVIAMKGPAKTAAQGER